MPSRHDTAFAAAAQTALLAWHGETITHRPLGDSANDASVTVIWRSDGCAQVDDAGRGTRHLAAIQVDEDLSVDKTDQWLRDSVQWETKTICKPSGDGFRMLELVRYESESRTVEGRDIRTMGS